MKSLEKQERSRKRRGKGLWKLERRRSSNSEEEPWISPRDDTILGPDGGTSAGDRPSDKQSSTM